MLNKIVQGSGFFTMLCDRGHGYKFVDSIIYFSIGLFLTIIVLSMKVVKYVKKHLLGLDSTWYCDIGDHGYDFVIIIMCFSIGLILIVFESNIIIMSMGVAIIHIIFKKIPVISTKNYNHVEQRIFTHFSQHLILILAC